MYASHLNQCSGSGSSRGATRVLLRSGRSRRRGSPRLAVHALLGVAPLPRPLEVVVEGDEVERRADPGDPGDHVQPAEQQVEPVGPVGVDQRAASGPPRSRPARGARSRAPPRRVRSRRSRSISRISARERRRRRRRNGSRTSPRRPGSDTRARRGPPGRLPGCRACGELLRRSRGARRAPHLLPVVRSCATRRPAERILELREQLDEAGRPLEELRELSPLSCRGSSRIRRARRAAGRGSGRPRARAPARPGGRTAKAGGRRGGTRPARARRRAPRSVRRRPSLPAPTARPASELDADAARRLARGRCRGRGSRARRSRRQSSRLDAVFPRDLRPRRRAPAGRRGRSPRRRRQPVDAMRGASTSRRPGRRRLRARGRRSARRRSRRTCRARASRCRRGPGRGAAARASRSASRAVIAAGPPRPRATSSACLTSKRGRCARSTRIRPPRGRPRTASTSSRTGATPAPSRRFDVGQCATPTPRPRRRHVRLGQVDAVGAPDLVRQPPDPLQVLDRRAAVELEAVRVLLDRLREVRVQRRPSRRASSADSRISSFVTENGEHGATAI